MRNSSTNLTCMKPVHPENALDQPPPPASPPSKSLSEKVACCIGTFSVLGFLSFVGFVIFGLVWLGNDGFSDPFATFKVESLSPRSIMSQEHWDITLRVGNPRSEKDYGLNLSYKVAHVYLWFGGETIAMGDIPAFDVLMEKNIVLNGTLNALYSYPGDKILHDSDTLVLDIVVPVSMVDPSVRPETIYDTLTVKCLYFRRVTSSTTQEIQFQSERCIFPDY